MLSIPSQLWISIDRLSGIIMLLGLVGLGSPLAAQDPPRSIAVTWSGVAPPPAVAVHLFTPEAKLPTSSLHRTEPGHGMLHFEAGEIRKQGQWGSVPLQALDPGRFELRSADGLWLARHQREPTPGSDRRKDAGAWHFVGRACATLQVHAKTHPMRTQHAPEVEVVRAAALPRIQVSPAEEPSQIVELANQQPARFLDPGRYRIVVSARSHATREVWIEAQAGQACTPRIDLNVLPNLHNVHVWVDARSPTPPWILKEGDPMLAWQQPGDERAWFLDLRLPAPSPHTGEWTARAAHTPAIRNRSQRNTAPLQWERSAGHLVGKATLFGVPLGKLRPHIHCPHSSYLTQTSTLWNGDQRIQVHLLHPTEEPGWGFSLQPSPELEQPSDGLLPSGELHWMDASGEVVGGMGVYGYSVVVPDSLAKAPTTWAYTQWQHQVVYGTAQDFVATANGQRVAPIVLRKGYSTQVMVRGPEGQPLANLAVLADGTEVGRTDDFGGALVVLAQAPGRLQVRWNERQLVQRIFPGAAPQPWLRFEF